MLHYERATGVVHQLRADYLPMGIVPEVQRMPIRRIALAPGDLFAVLTDGFFEFMNDADEQYGLDRVAEHLQRADQTTCAEIIGNLRSDLDRFGHGRSADDDLTAVLIRRLD
jgi:sigma-B regulation protein RsbU (phosphoserine phosphatase)